MYEISIFDKIFTQEKLIGIKKKEDTRLENKAWFFFLLYMKFYFIKISNFIIDSMYKQEK